MLILKLCRMNGMEKNYIYFFNVINEYCIRFLSVYNVFVISM